VRTFKKVRRYFGDQPPAGTPPTPQGEQPPAEGGTPPPPPKPADKTFTKAEVEKLIAERVGQITAKTNKEKQADLERIRALETDAAKKVELEAQIEELRIQGLTKEQQAEERAKKSQKEYESKLKVEQETSAKWQKTYAEEKIVREITDAATDKDIDAFNPKQLVQLLRSDARIAEAKDAEGKPTGTFEVRIKYSTLNKEGQLQQLDLTPREMLKLMKDDPERFGNLFRAGVNGGIGGSAPQPIKKVQDLAKMDQDDFNKKWNDRSARKSLFPKN
jgi:hypothetical protein